MPRAEHPRAAAPVSRQGSCAPATGLGGTGCAPEPRSGHKQENRGCGAGLEKGPDPEIRCTINPTHTLSQPGAGGASGVPFCPAWHDLHPWGLAGQRFQAGRPRAARSLPASLRASSRHPMAFHPLPQAGLRGFVSPLAAASWHWGWPWPSRAMTVALTVATAMPHWAGTGCHCRTTAARLGSRAGWHCRAPASAPVTPTTTTASASVPRCCQEVSRGGGTPISTRGCPLGMPPSHPVPPRRLVVRRLRPLQPQRHLLPGPAQHPQAQRHPLAPLPGAQLLPEGHPHADTTRQLLGCQRPGRRWCQPGTGGRVWEKGRLGRLSPPRNVFPHFCFLLFIPSPGSLRITQRDGDTVASRTRG